MTSLPRLNKIDEIVEQTGNSTLSSFYRKKWGSAYQSEGTTTFPSLPTTTVEDLIACPFQKRSYIEKGLFVKVVYHSNIPFLIARTKHDIGLEEYGDVAFSRPLVLFESVHESVEKGLWLYERNRLPLVGKDNLMLTKMAAARYEVDAIISDRASLLGFVENHHGLFDTERITHLIVIDHQFDERLHNVMVKNFPRARTQLILALPEVGSIGKSCAGFVGTHPIFHSTKGALVEEVPSLIVTRRIFLPTPIIRYDTGLVIQKEQKTCTCESDTCFSLVPATLL